jgi:hypothetical protein
MKRWLCVGVIATAMPILSGGSWAGDFGCSNATLNGEYAFGVTDYTPPPSLVGSTAKVVNGIKYFDGNGHLLQQDYQGDDVAGDDFAPPGRETGTYIVNSNCTGSMVIHLNAPGFPTATSGEIDIMFVISDGGRHIHEVVSKNIPPGSAVPVPVQTSADDWKVAPAQDNQDNWTAH